MRETRDSFLARIRASLAKAGEWRTASLADDRPAPLPLARDALVPRFEQELVRAGGHVQSLARSEVAGAIVTLVRSWRARTFAAWRTELTDELKIAPGLERAGLERLAIQGQNIRQDLSGLDVGICEAALGLAETGSVVLQSGPDRSRLVTALARYNVVLLPTERLVSSLTDLPDLLRNGRTSEGRLRSNTVLLTGPSRTGDIEGQLVVGAHGALEQHVFLLR
jgi:L-lactate utilization protein LutC